MFWLWLFLFGVNFSGLWLDVFGYMGRPGFRFAPLHFLCVLLTALQIRWELDRPPVVRTWSGTRIELDRRLVFPWLRGWIMGLMHPREMLEVRRRVAETPRDVLKVPKCIEH